MDDSNKKILYSDYNKSYILTKIIDGKVNFQTDVPGGWNWNPMFQTTEICKWE